jgi:hypothetical protein
VQKEKSAKQKQKESDLGGIESVAVSIWQHMLHHLLIFVWIYKQNCERMQMNVKEERGGNENAYRGARRLRNKDVDNNKTS